MNATMTANRRTDGTSEAAEKGAGQRGAHAREEGAANNKPKTTRFRMIGQTVCIHCPREEWSELKGRYATVVNQWCDGSVLVEVERWYGSKARICFARHEVEHVALNDYLLHHEDAECSLIERSVRLGGYAGPYVPEHGWISDKVRDELYRRSDSLKVEIRALQRIKWHSLSKCARNERHGLSNFCTAIVPYEGGAL